jgi:hypothetical protein
MNVTLSADGQLVEKARRYATSHSTTLNQLFRDYLVRLVGEYSSEEAASEFEVIARTMAGRSPEGWRFDRQKAHRHEADA